MLTGNGTLLPFCVGFPLRKGDFPQDVRTDIGAQVTVKNRWPDGSAKFAIVAGRATIAGSTAVRLTAAGASSTATALTTADLKATGISASVGCGTFGSASWSVPDWDAPFQTWISGPEMSSWIYRRPIGVDPHLVAWLEVRLFAGGAVEVLPWIENGYLRVSGPTSKRTTYTFALGGSSRFSATFDLPQHCRTPLVSNVLSYWLGTDPNVAAQHDPTYLMASRLVPSYVASVSPLAPRVVQGLVSDFAPLQIGDLPSAMGAGGYDASIGILPEWDVLYLTSTSSKPYKALQWNGYSAGRFGFHFRDETTHRPLKFSSYPNLCLDQSESHGIAGAGPSTTDTYTPTGSGTAPPNYAISHHPSMGYMAYLVTGRWYFMEEIQFAATINFLKSRNDTRGGWDGSASAAPRPGSAGIFQSASSQMTTRGAAWGLRTLAQAWAATPDGDVLKPEFLASIAENVNWHHARYVARANNPLGFVQPFSNYTAGKGVYFEANWMQDFHTAAFGFLKSLEPDLSAAEQLRLTEFFAWKAKSVVGRLGGAGPREWLYRDAAPYTVAVAPADAPDYVGGTGPWFSDFGQAYAATYAGGGSGAGPWDPRAREIGDGSIRNEVSATSYYANMQPAIAYAVTHGVAGAREAYDRMTGASNWAAFLAAANDAPVWWVRPHAG